MAYSTPPTFVALDPLAAADLNILGDDIAALKAITDGVSFSAVRLSRVASTSIANATWTPVTWTAETYDYGGWWSSGTDIVVPAGAIPAGYTSIAVIVAPFGASFAADSTGYRGCRVTLNGSSSISATQPGFSSDTATITSSGIIIVEAGDILNLEVYQNSGGALAATFMQAVVSRLAPVA